jgi:hypothetical protein
VNFSSTTLVVGSVALTSFVTACSGGGQSTRVSSPLPLEDLWDCEVIIGPVNNGPGACPDCISELCVEVTSANLLRFALQVREAPEDPTELCELSSVIVKQSTTTLYDGDLEISPIDLEEGFTVIASEQPIVSANASIGATIEVEGAFGRPTCN